MTWSALKLYVEKEEVKERYKECLSIIEKESTPLPTHPTRVLEQFKNDKHELYRESYRKAGELRVQGSTAGEVIEEVLLLGGCTLSKQTVYNAGSSS